MVNLTEPQLPQVLEPPAIAALHLGQVLCISATLRRFLFAERWDLCRFRPRVQGVKSLTKVRDCLLLRFEFSAVCWL